MNAQQRNDLIASAQSGDLIYLSGGDWTSQLVKFGESQFDPTWTANLAHVVFVDKDRNISECTIELQTIKISGFPWVKFNLISGVRITPIEQWAVDDGIVWPWLIVQRFDNMSLDIIEKATEEGKAILASGEHYSILDLAGTLLTYFNYNIAGWFSFINKDAVAKWQQNIITRSNPFYSKKAEYCIAYVDECFMSGGFKIIPDDINDSVSNLGDGMRRLDRAYTLHFISHLGIKDYHKNIGEQFNSDCIKDYKPSNI